MAHEIAKIAKQMISGRAATKPYNKSLPEATPLTESFWEGTKRHELLLQKCGECGSYQWYPKPWCVECGCRDMEWTKASGTGTVYSYTEIRQVVLNAPGFEEDIPFALATIELDEGPRLVAQLRGVKPEGARPGIRVKVSFVDATSEVSIPVFEPA